MSDAKYLGLTANKLARIASDLEAENARLREKQREYQATIDSLVDECTDHKVENAKLREHIASFIELSQDMVIYAGQNMKRHFAKRLRKLGVPL